MNVPLVLATSLTIGATTSSYYLSRIPHPTDGQKGLMTVLNGITGAGAAAVFGLLK
jgi:hypothetical protein